jgi:hypothetical protein
MMDSLEETLEFFSTDGKPLRASLVVSLSQQKITRFFDPNNATAGSTATPPGAGPSPAGTRPLTASPAGASLQALADIHGPNVSWQSIASANGIENPRLLATGQLIDLNLSIG